MRIVKILRLFPDRVSRQGQGQNLIVYGAAFERLRKRPEANLIAGILRAMRQNQTPMIEIRRQKMPPLLLDGWRQKGSFEFDVVEIPRKAICFERLFCTSCEI
ncbi:hypothetical protein [Microvirga alba]|uniref:hypothetical protein n=1 Tax=Microvirga alba TaxID=2791025 RepID=UPI001AEF12A3|nr:hypothetical protein [Microvirga alba]